MGCKTRKEQLSVNQDIKCPYCQKHTKAYETKRSCIGECKYCNKEFYVYAPFGGHSETTKIDRNKKSIKETI